MRVRRAGGAILLLVLAAACGGGGTRLDEAPRIEASAPLDPAVAQLLTTRADAVDAAPADPEAWAALGRAFHANELFDLAETSYRQALVRDGARADWWYLLAIVGNRQGDLDVALEAIETSIDRDDTYMHAWWRRGDWLREQDRRDEASESYDQALALDPTSDLPRVGKARLLLDAGETEQAVEALRDLIAERPDLGLAHFLLGNALRELGRDEEASRHLRRGQPGRVIQGDRWLQSIQRDRVGFGSRVSMGNQYLNEGRFDDARLMFEVLRAERPDDLRVLEKLGTVYLRLGKTSEALQVLESANQLDPQDATVLFELGAAYRAADRLEDAVEATRRAVDLNPTRALGQARLGRLLEESGRQEEAVAAYAQATRYDPTDPALWAAEGDGLGRLGRWADAADRYGQALANSGDDPDLFVRHGVALFRAGKFGEAQASLERSLELGPSRPDRVEALLAEVRRRAAG